MRNGLYVLETIIWCNMSTWSYWWISISFLLQRAKNEATEETDDESSLKFTEGEGKV